MLNSLIFFLAAHVVTSLAASTPTVFPFRCDLHFSKASLCAQLTWVAGPWLEDDSVLKIQFFNSVSFKPQSPEGDVRVEIKMPDMEMCLQPPTINRDRSSHPTGEYLVEDLVFGMDGRWHLILEIKDIQRQNSERKFQCLDIQGKAFKSC